MIRPLGLLALAALACTGAPDDPDTASDTAVDGWPDYEALSDGAFATAWGLYDEGPLVATTLAQRDDDRSLYLGGGTQFEELGDHRGAFGWAVGTRPEQEPGTRWVDVSDTSLGWSWTHGVAVDPTNGTVALAAEWSGQFTLGTTLSDTTGGGNLALVRLDPSGSPVWVRQAGHFETFGDGELYPRALALDSQGTAVVAGWFEGSVVFGEGSSATQLDSGSLENPDGFAAVYDGTGDFLGTFALPGPGADGVTAAAIVGSGYALAGTFERDVTVGVTAGTPVVLAAQDDADGFVGRYAADSALLWARRLGSDSQVQVYDVQADEEGALWVSGAYVEALTVAPGTPEAVTLDPSSSGSWTGFVARFASDGRLDWAQAIVATEAVYPEGLAVHGTDAVVVGSFTGETTLDPAGTSVTNVHGGQDALATRFDATGAVQWARVFGGPEDDTAVDVVVDPDGIAWVGGSFHDTITFDEGGPREQTLGIAGTGAFVAGFAL